MGVTGAGKTTVGKLLARELGWRFLDADSFHSPANIAKMTRGFPLTDSDREPWLKSIHTELLECARKKENAVLACSALKQRYRDLLAAGMDLKICFLKGAHGEIAARLHARRGHFADDSILAGQFADLEEPSDALVLPVGEAPETVVREALRKLNLTPSL
jgi:gluconokinase